MDGSPHVSYDPERGAAPALPDDIARDLIARGAVLLLSDAAAQKDRWAARTAVAIATQLAALRRVVLADLGFAQPLLHELLELPNGEGLADVFLFGASPEHVALPAPIASLSLIPAGQFVPDPAAVLAHEGWTRVLSQLRADGEVLLAYSPADAPGLADLAARIPSVVALAGGLGEVGAESMTPSTAQLLTTVIRAPRAATPATRGTRAPLSREPSDAERARHSFERVRLPRDGERDALIADLRSRQRAALTAPVTAAPVEVHPSPVVGGPDAPPLTEPPAAAARVAEPEPRRRRPLLLSLALLLLVSLLAGVWHFGRAYLRSGTMAPPPPVVQTPASSAQPLTGEPAGVPLPYSVAIEAHPDLPTAVRRVTALARAPDAPGFYIAPILVDSALYYRVMAGPVADSAAAAVMWQALITRGLKTGGSEWDIRATPYAFLLGEYELREQAEQRMAQIGELNIPSYIIEVPYTNGPPRYYLYSGAYSGAPEAEVMRQLLRNAGLPTNLVERTGRSSS